MSDLINRIKKAGTLDSILLSDKPTDIDYITTSVPILNVALSGSLHGGLTPGITVLAGPSRHFKSNLGLVMVKAYLDKYENSVCMFYDSEDGITQPYIEQTGIDSDRVIYTPISSVEDLRSDIMGVLNELTIDDHVIFFIDSMGNLASLKETQDALDGKNVADMTRAKTIKSMTRLITPQLNNKKLPLIAINHVYETMEMYSKTVMGGGTGFYLSANTIIFIGRSKEKDNKETIGHKFTMLIEKSRFIKEGSKLPIKVTFDDFIDKNSGLLELAIEFGIVTIAGAWLIVDGFDQKVRRNQLDQNWYDELLLNKLFDKQITQKYSLNQIEELDVDLNKQN